MSQAFSVNFPKFLVGAVLLWGSAFLMPMAVQAQVTVDENSTSFKTPENSGPVALEVADKLFQVNEILNQERIRIINGHGPAEFAAAVNKNRIFVDVPGLGKGDYTELDGVIVPKIVLWDGSGVENQGDAYYLIDREYFEEIFEKIVALNKSEEFASEDPDAASLQSGPAKEAQVEGILTRHMKRLIGRQHENAGGVVIDLPGGRKKTVYGRNAHFVFLDNGSIAATTHHPVPARFSGGYFKDLYYAHYKAPTVGDAVLGVSIAAAQTAVVYGTSLFFPEIPTPWGQGVISFITGTLIGTYIEAYRSFTSSHKDQDVTNNRKRMIGLLISMGIGIQANANVLSPLQFGAGAVIGFIDPNFVYWWSKTLFRNWISGKGKNAFSYGNTIMTDLRLLTGSTSYREILQNAKASPKNFEYEFPPLDLKYEIEAEVDETILPQVEDIPEVIAKKRGILDRMVDIIVRAKLKTDLALQEELTYMNGAFKDAGESILPSTPQGNLFWDARFKKASIHYQKWYMINFGLKSISDMFTNASSAGTADLSLWDKIFDPGTKAMAFIGVFQPMFGKYYTTAIRQGYIEFNYKVPALNIPFKIKINTDQSLYVDNIIRKEIAEREELLGRKISVTPESFAAERHKILAIVARREKLIDEEILNQRATLRRIKNRVVKTVRILISPRKAFADASEARKSPDYVSVKDRLAYKITDLKYDSIQFAENARGVLAAAGNSVGKSAKDVAGEYSTAILSEYREVGASVVDGMYSTLNGTGRSCRKLFGNNVPRDQNN